MIQFARTASFQGEIMSDRTRTVVNLGKLFFPIGDTQYALGASHTVSLDRRYQISKGNRDYLFGEWLSPRGVSLTFSKVWYPPDYKGLNKKVKEEWMRRNKTLLCVVLTVRLESNQWRVEVDTHGTVDLRLQLEDGYGTRFGNNPRGDNYATLDDSKFMTHRDLKKEITLSVTDVHRSHEAIKRMLRPYFDLLIARILKLPKRLSCFVSVDKERGLTASLKINGKLLESSLKNSA